MIRWAIYKSVQKKSVNLSVAFLNFIFFVSDKQANVMGQEYGGKLFYAERAQVYRKISTLCPGETH